MLNVEESMDGNIQTETPSLSVESDIVIDKYLGRYFLMMLRSVYFYGPHSRL